MSDFFFLGFFFGLTFFLAFQSLSVLWLSTFFAALFPFASFFSSKPIASDVFFP